uniref:Ig-like domain-containing protein n=1 Tax=Oreochromis niloticus TaxID=8128 RepID=A0A669DHK5_ORENI
DVRTWLWFSPSLCTRVQQVPSSILGSLNGETAISCNHSESTYNVILWYQKPRGDSALKLIGYILYGNPTIEDGFQESFKISGDGSVKSQLEVEKLKAEDSGIYYCAASTHSELVNVLLLQKPYMILRHINKQRRREHLHLAAVYGRKSPMISKFFRKKRRVWVIKRSVRAGKQRWSKRMKNNRNG